MKRILLGTVLLVAILCSPLMAKIYKYVDADGNLRFTNDITQVPDDQREKMATIDEIPSTAADDEVQKKLDAALDQVMEANRQADQAAAEAAQKKRSDELEKRRAALEEEREALEREIKALGPQPSRAAPTARLRTYNYQMETLNTKVEAHQAEMDALERELEELGAAAGQ